MTVSLSPYRYYVAPANTFLAGPTTGSDAVMTVRTLVAADIPSGSGSPLTTKADLYIYSTTNDRLAVGSDSTLLIADSAQAKGLRWGNNPVLSGATIDNSAIGAVTPLTGAFTTLSTTGTTIFGDGSAASTVRMNGAAGQAKDLAWQTAGGNRYILRTTSTAESGSNNGSNWNFLIRDDTGAALGTPWVITRATGAFVWAGYTDAVQHTFKESASQVSDLAQWTTSTGTLGVAVGPSTIASATSAVWNRFRLPAQTLTITGSAAITTANGLNMVEFGIPTLSAASALNITTAATLAIIGAPVVAGSATATNLYALNVVAGNARFGGSITTTNGITSTGNSTWSDCSLTSTRSLLVASTDGVALTESSAATGAATIKYSPRLRFLSRAWDTSASQTVEFWAEVQPISAATPTGSVVWSYSLNGAAALTVLALGSTGTLTLRDAANIATGTTTGTIIATATSQKLGHWGSTPIIQPASANQAAVVATGSTNITPYGFTQAQADSIVTLVNQLRSDLVSMGLIKGSA